MRSAFCPTSHDSAARTPAPTFGSAPSDGSARRFSTAAGMLSTATTANAVAALFATNGTAAPTPNSRPPSNGPTNSLPATSPATNRPFARSSNAAGTNRGITVWAAVSRSVSATPSSNAATATSATLAAPTATRVASPASTTMRSTSAVTTRPRAPRRSASEPAARPATSHGTVLAAVTSDTHAALSVRLAASNGKAASRIPSPTLTSTAAVQNRQKCVPRLMRAE